MLRQFRPSNGGSLCEQWLATSQTSTFMDYRKFIETVAPLDRLPEDIMLGQFLNGLKEDIRAEVRVLNPISLEKAMELALRVEERNKVNFVKKAGIGTYKIGQYSSVSFKNPSPGGQRVTASSRVLCRFETGHLTAESQGSVNSPKPLSQASVGKAGGEMRRVTD